MKIRYTTTWFDNNASLIREWFDPDTFDWVYSNLLARSCSKDFDLWYDPDTFNWFYGHYLARNCSEHFTKWFNHETFNWLENKYYLSEYCLAYIDIWYDPSKYPESYDELLLASIK